MGIDEETKMRPSFMKSSGYQISQRDDDEADSLSMNEREDAYEKRKISIWKEFFASYFAWTRLAFSFSQVKRGVHLIIPVLTRERRKTCMKWKGEKGRHNVERGNSWGWRVDNNCHRRLSPFWHPLRSFAPYYHDNFHVWEEIHAFLSHTNVSLLCVSDLSRRLISASLWGRFPLCPLQFSFSFQSPT